MRELLSLPLEDVIDFLSRNKGKKAKNGRLGASKVKAPNTKMQTRANEDDDDNCGFGMGSFDDTQHVNAGYS